MLLPMSSKECLIESMCSFNFAAERALAIELVQNLRGVKSVNAKELAF
jgi:hypothetical protein